jgi:hypothetical protein
MLDYRGRTIYEMTSSTSGIRAVLSVTPPGNEDVYPSFVISVDQTLASITTLTSYSDTYKAKKIG